MADLLSCPFCLAHLDTIRDYDGDTLYAHPDSDNCVLSGMAWDGDEFDAAAWNRRSLTAAFASRPSQGGEWDNVVLAACRVAWPNFDAFGKESKTKRLKEMREAMLSASPSTGHFHIAHDDFAGDVIGYYTTREGKPGVVMQQDGTRVVHVYGAKWLKPVEADGNKPS